ncbi:MAG: DUF4350 domain-containing protein, partial [Ginsengibacter sp.]
MKLLFKYMVCVALIGTTGIGCVPNLRSRLPSLTESYRKTDKLPFGSFIAYQGFESEFRGYRIRRADKPFDKTWIEMKDDPGFGSQYSLYFLITKDLMLTDDETNAMMHFVKEGNDLFISAEYVDTGLLEAVFCKVDVQNELISEAMGRMGDTFVSMYYGDDFKSQRYGYYYFPFSNYIKSYDSSVTRVLGVNEQNLPNYVVLFFGKGRLYLHLAPRAFSNYFLLTKENFKYFNSVTAYLRYEPQYVYWDEYYKNITPPINKNLHKKNADDDFSSLSVLRKNPSLWWAFCIATTGILLFVIFNVKRKQKPVKIIMPHSNTTVAFAETIGALYLQQKNNKNIADKMITYFYEYLRRKYFINTSSIDGYFI